jgi:hypothetical protein
MSISITLWQTVLWLWTTVRIDTQEVRGGADRISYQGGAIKMTIDPDMKVNGC